MLPHFPKARVSRRSCSARSVGREATARERLQAFDGLLWDCPASATVSWARQLQDVIPQIIVNRTPDDLNYVSTDHAAAFYAITSERLNAHPDGLPVFLGLKNTSKVLSLRKNGFVRACRERQVFYEMLNLPVEFADKCAALDPFLDNRDRRPLLLISAARQNTGAVMRWVHDHGLCWGRDICYSDFDNDATADVYGKRVTSFIQDYPGMQDLALSRLIDLMDGVRDRVQILCPALRREGDT